MHPARVKIGPKRCRGSGAKLGPFKSKVAAVGPEVGYAFTIDGLPVYFNLRGYWEFWAENRIQGYAAFATLVIPLGPKKSTGNSQ